MAPRRRSASRTSSSSGPGGSDGALPAWARLQGPRGFGGNGNRSSCGPRAEDPLPLAEEEAYLRTMTYHEAARCVDWVVRETLRELGVDVLRDMEALLGGVAVEPRTTAEATSENDKTPHRSQDRNGTEADSGQNGESHDDKNKLELEGFDDSWARCFVSPRGSGELSAALLRLLPVLLLEAPFHPLDAHEWMQHLVQAIQERFKRTCVVWLRKPPAHHASGAGLTSSADTSFLSLYIQELTRQCLWQEQEREEQSKLPRPPALSIKELRRSTHCAELLQLWAARTRHFDNILVLLPPGDGASAAALLRWTAEQRHRHGLPLHVVVLHRAATAAAAAGGDALVEALRRDHTYRVRRSSLPTARAVLANVWDRLYMGRGFGMHLPDTVLEALHQGFGRAHGSFVHVVLQLKASLAQLLAENVGLGVMGLLNGGLNDADDSSDLCRRRQWFLFDGRARRMIEIRIPSTESQEDYSPEKSKKKQRSDKNNPVDDIDPSYRRRQWIHDMELHRRKIAVVMQLEACLMQWYQQRTQAETSSYLMLRLNSTSILSMSDKAGQETISKETVKELITILQCERQKHADKPTDTPDSDASDILSETNKMTQDAIAQDAARVSLTEFIDRLVVVLDQVTFFVDVIHTFESIYQEWFGCFQRGLKQKTSLSSLSAHQSLQTRRETVRGLVETTNASEFLPGSLYRLIDSCFSVSLDEWFDLFESHSQRAFSGGDPKFNFLTFASGIYALQVMGLIKGERKTSVGRRNLDKAVLVWCGTES